MGKLPYLSEFVEKEISEFIKKLKTDGISISNSLVLTVSLMIIRELEPTIENNHTLNISWAVSFKRRWGFVIPRGPYIKCGKFNDINKSDIMKKRRILCRNVHSHIKKNNIQEELVINIDQLEISLLPGYNISGKITILIGLTRDGYLLPAQLIFPGTTKNCLPHCSVIPNNCHVTFSQASKSNSNTMIEYVKTVLIPYINSIEGVPYGHQCKSLLIFDRNTAHRTKSFRNLLHRLNIYAVEIPTSYTKYLQPIDIQGFVANHLRNEITKQFCEYYSNKIRETAQSNSQIWTSPNQNLEQIKEYNVLWISKALYSLQMETKKLKDLWNNIFFKKIKK